MKFFKTDRVLPLLLGLWAFFPFAAFPQGEGIVVDEIVAKVDNYIILKSEVEKTYLSMLSSGENMGPNPRCAILRQLIVGKIMLAKAEMDSIMVDDITVEAQLEQRMQYFVMQAGSEEKLERTLGKKLSELKDELRDQVYEQMTVEKMRGEVTSSIKVTPAEVKAFFKTLPKDSIPFLPAEVKAGQIVISPEINESAKMEARQKLLEIKARVEAGEDFGSLATKFSEDAGSARNGGDLGWHGRGELVPEFEATALRIEPGEIADPVESEFGFHLIQLLERRGNRFRARHVLIRPKSNSLDVETGLEKLDSIRNLIVLDSMTFEEAAREFSEDQPTRANAGFFKDDNTGSSMVPNESLDPVIFFTLDTMQAGQISQPMTFRRQDGSTGLRIIYFERSIPPHYANMKDDYQKLYKATLASKRDEHLRDWIGKAKRDVFIYIEPEYNDCNIVQQL